MFTLPLTAEFSAADTAADARRALDAFRESVRPSDYGITLVAATPDNRLVAQVQSQIAQATGRRYRINLDALNAESLRELQRLLSDLDYEHRAAVSRARRMPWRG